MPDDVTRAAETRQASEPLGAIANRPAPGSGAPAPLEPGPVESLHDPRVLQILSTEHWSLLSARSLAYNEAFTRGAMFLAFLSMSFVALALVAQARPIDREFLFVLALVLAFDLVVGLTTYGRIIGAGSEDYRAVHGMARIRHGYGQIAPVVLPYFTSSVHDDLRGVMVSYGSPPLDGLGALIHQLTTSGGMIGLIVSMIGGVLGLVVALSVGTTLPVAFGVAAVAGLGLFLGLVAVTVRVYSGVQATVQVSFPSPPDDVPAA